MELQLPIYKYALTSSNGTLIFSTCERITYSTDSLEGFPKISKNNAAVALLATCKHIHNAAHKLLYTSNTFFILVHYESERFPPLAPDIPENTVDNVLRKVQHAFLVVGKHTLDFTFCSKPDGGKLLYSCLEQATELKTLRVAMMGDLFDLWYRDASCTKTAENLIEKGPEGCYVEVGIGSGKPEMQFVDLCMRRNGWDPEYGYEVLAPALKRSVKRHLWCHAALEEDTDDDEDVAWEGLGSSDACGEDGLPDMDL